MNKKSLLSIVVPVYNESQSIDAFYKRTTQTVRELDSFCYEFVFVDDGSHDNSYSKLVELADSDPNVRIIKLSRNFGHQIAITAGMDAAVGDAVVVIDADLQDPPEAIRKFVGKWQEGYDVVYGIREKREGESKLKLLTAKYFYRILNSLTDIDIPADVGDFRLMSRRVVLQLKKIQERDRYIRGLVSWLGFRQTGIYYSRDKRYAGNTKFSYRKMLRFALDGITSFSTLPLKLATWLGYLASLLGFLYACSVVVQKALGITVQGWATMMIAMLFLGGVQLIFLGVLGEYIGRIFRETKQRPIYIVEELYDQTIRSQRFAEDPASLRALDVTSQSAIVAHSSWRSKSHS